MPVKPITVHIPSWYRAGMEEAEFNELSEIDRQNRERVLGRVYWGADIFNVPEADWVLSNFIQLHSMTVVGGPAGSGKSLLMMDWANTLANPRLDGWHGFSKGQPAYNVLYIAAEGGDGIPKRLRAWMEFRSTEEAPNVGWLPRRVKLNMKGAPSEIHNELRRLILDNHVEVLFIDTLAQTFTGNENQQQDMNEWLDGLQYVAGEFGVSIVLAHHTPRATKGQLRGSNVLDGHVNVVLMLDGKSGDPNVKLAMAKNKEGPHVPTTNLVMKPMADSVVLDTVGAGVGFMGKVQMAIWEYVKENVGSTTRQIADALERSPSSTHQLLKKLELNGQLESRTDGDDPVVWSVVELEEL